MRSAYAFLISAMILIAPAAAHAAEGCTLVVDYDTTAILHEDGDCKTRHGAQSTFKIPLAVMGFDSGILNGAHSPVWPYDPSYETNREEERHPADPTRWEKDSIVWYSQKLTKKLGMRKFKSYVNKFNYGNKDVSGDPGKNNGLTHAWLSSSLQISPVEQIAFIRALLGKKLGVSDSAYRHTKEIIPRFFAGEFAVHGKTGTGFEKSADGTINRERQQGWFVGWAEGMGKKIVFAKFIADDQKETGYAGPRARDAFLKELPEIMAMDRHNEH
jgi:beta-lactamase class D